MPDHKTNGHTDYFRVRARNAANNQSTYAGGNGNVVYRPDLLHFSGCV